MSPRARTPSFAVVRAALDAQWDVLLAGLPLLDPTGPTAVAGWTVREVEAHLTATTGGLARLLAAAGPAAADTGVTGWAAALPGLAAVVDADARSTAPALAAAVAEARGALDAADPTRNVAQRTGAHTLSDALVFRLVEGVVHGLDLGIEPARPALKEVVRALVQVLAERVPGHAVELRVPPYAVVQCVAGPRHTRGTPPGTVEVDPVAWLLVATGRLAWEDAVSEGRIRVRGDRADLRDHLPLLS